jgi:hypothetical protein
MTTDMGDGWKMYQGPATYKHPCAVCGEIVSLDPVYKAKQTMHPMCFNSWLMQGRPELKPAIPSESAANALSSASPGNSVSRAEEASREAFLTMQLIESLKDIALALREQTGALIVQGAK